MLEHEIIVSLRDNKTAKAIWDACPIESRAEKWGDEIYFKTPVIVDKELDAKQILEKGELAFWVEGSSIAIGYGPTPISENEEIKLITRANVFGDTNYELSSLSNVGPGEFIKVEKA